MNPRKYHVSLTQEEYEYLTEITSKGSEKAYKIPHANILLKLYEPFNEKPWTIPQIAKAFSTNSTSVCNIGKRFVEQGLEAALNRKKQENRHHKITGEVEAHMTTIACSEPPQGRSRWTLQMIADKLVELKVGESISATAVGTTLKK